MHPDKITAGHSLSPYARAFPDTRNSPALSEEDAFMQIHGGRGSRTIYIIVMGIEAGFIALVRAPGSTAKRLRRLWANCTATPGAKAAAGSANACRAKVCVHNTKNDGEQACAPSLYHLKS